jgi:DNA ligase-associated metallophosphoesterase
MTIRCKNEELLLCKERAIYWKARKMLIISDLHLGKSAFFRKSGIQVPAAVAKTDLQKLASLLEAYPVDVLLITGDMFHNYMNQDVEDFSLWRAQYPGLKIQLVKGNHDSLKPSAYRALDIEVFSKELIAGPFRFIHDQPGEADEYYNITGHIHPGITIFGKARQHLRFPCFYFGKSYAILPAFSVFTGLSMIQAQEGDHVYAITPTSVVAI